jgi:diacylglycerol kinase family enzyme
MKQNMKVLLVHNPGAGDQEYGKEKLISLLEDNGYDCRYSSTKKEDWADFDHSFDMIVSAGGDGTVRKIVKELVHRKLIDKTWPVALLPLGTANNLSKTLGVKGKPEEIIPRWSTGRTKSIDIGRIGGVDGSRFMMESAGFGVFPYLMQEMRKLNAPKNTTPEQEMNTALRLLQSVVTAYEARECTLEIDGVDYSGSYMLLEIMNIRSIGPNLFLAPDADPGDGQYEVVMLPEDQKARFLEYISAKLNGKERTYEFNTVRGRTINASWHGSHLHVDDKTVKVEKGGEVRVRLRDALVKFVLG